MKGDLQHKASFVHDTSRRYTKAIIIIKFCIASELTSGAHNFEFFALVKLTRYVSYQMGCACMYLRVCVCVFVCLYGYRPSHIRLGIDAHNKRFVWNQISSSMMHMFANHSNVAVSPNEPLMMMTRLVYIYIYQMTDMWLFVCMSECVCALVIVCELMRRNWCGIWDGMKIDVCQSFMTFIFCAL